MEYSELSSFTDSSSDKSDIIDNNNLDNFNNIYNKILLNFENIEKMDNNINDKIREFSEYIKVINKNKKDTLRELKKDIVLLEKINKKNLSKIPKKRKCNNKGFNIIEPIPKEIKEYCGNIIPIEINNASRPYVISALHKAFKRDGLKIGRDTILDKKSAKILKKNEGYVIKFHEYQKFLSSYYKLINV
jgi:hypothetical protein